MRCANDHQVPPGAAFCPFCGTPAAPEEVALPAVAISPSDQAPTAPATPVASPSPGAGSPAQRLRSWWATASIEERIRRGLPVAVIALIVVGAVIAGVVSGSSGSGGGSPSSDQSSAASATTPPTLPMFDPNATQAAVVSSIESHFCTGSPNSFTIGGQTTVNCTGSDTSVFGMARFTVFTSPTAFQATLNSGALSCQQGDILVFGPSWDAILMSSTEAAALIQQGGTSGTCNFNGGNSGGGQSNNSGGIPNCPDGTTATPNGNGPGWLCDDGTTIP